MGPHHPQNAEAGSHDRGVPPATDENRDLLRLLAAEQAAVEYWRNVAEQRRSSAAAVQRRPMVRAAIHVDRRTAPLHRSARNLSSRLRSWADSIRLRTRAVLTIPALGQRRRRLHSQAALADRASPAPGDPTEVLVIDIDRAVALGDSDLRSRHRTAPAAQPAQPRSIAVADLNRLVERCRPDAVCILSPQVAPISASWIRRLTQALSPDVAVALPTLVHPERPGRRTPHDLLTRSRGIAVDSIDGAPVPRSLGAGDPVDIGADRVDPAAASAGCVVVAGDAWREVGGLAVGEDADSAVLDLTLRVGAAGYRIVNLPEVLVTDWRPVDGPRGLESEVAATSTAWRTAIGHHGPTLRRLSGGGTTGVEAGDPPISITLTTSVPSAKLIATWGDWNFASAFAEAIRRAGHRVRLQTLDEVEDPAARSNDVQVVLRGLFPAPRSPGQPHVLWVISHPEAVGVDEMDAADLVLVASPRFADHVRSLTTTPVEVFLQATDPHHFQLRSPARARSHGVLVVANSRGVRRRVVADAAAARIEHSVVGEGWEGVVEPGRLIAAQVAYPDLPSLYADADLVLNDHWDTMAHWGFVSNRVLDVLACGTPVVSDHLPELEEMFGDLVPTWNDPASLAALVDDLRADPETWEKRALAARDLVIAHHTFDHRARELIDLLDRHGLASRPVPR